MFEFNFVIDTPDEGIDGKKPGHENSTGQPVDEDQEPLVDETLVPCGCLTFNEISATKGANQESVEFQKISLFTDSQLKYHWENYEAKLDASYIYYVDSYRLKLGEEDLIGKVNKTHDVVTGQYEGGLKVWELCIDLARLVYNIDVPPSSTELRAFFERACSPPKGKRQFNILELGCGHAIPSLAVLKHLADTARHANPADLGTTFQVTVYLQDFNKQVIENITYENVKKFLSTHKLPFNVDFRFAFGDWHQLLRKQVLPSNTFNLILTSETIYNSQNYKHLLNLFRSCMLRPVPDAKPGLESVTLLAAKSIYFGCGGNLHDFLKLAKSSQYGFQVSADILEPFYRDLKATAESQTLGSAATVTSSSSPEEPNDEDQVDVATVSKEIVQLHF